MISIAIPGNSQQSNDWLTLGKNSVRQGNIELALRNYELHIEENPQDPIGYIHRARLYNAMGRTNESIMDIDIAQRLNPLSLMYVDPELRSKYSAKKTYNYSYDNLDNSFVKSATKFDDYMKLKEKIDLSHSQDEIFTDVIYNLYRKDIDKAEELLKEVIISDENKSLYYDLYGKINLKRNKYAVAIEHFTISIEHNPKFSIAYHNRSIAYQLLGEYEKAKEDLDSAIDLNNDISLFYFSLAKLNEKTGDEDSAMNNYESAIEIDENYAEALTNYSLLLKGLGEYDEGIKYLNKAIKSSNDMVENSFLKAKLNFIYGEYALAVDEYENYLQENPNDGEALYNIGLAKILLRKKDEGCMDISKSLELVTNNKNKILYQLFCEDR